MKRLYLLRHAKSDWTEGVSDEERPLNARGRKAAARMGRFLTEQDGAPDWILCSTAVRARETLAQAAEAGGWEAAALHRPALYLPTVGEVLAEVEEVPDDVERLLVVGHQPTWAQTVGVLCGGAQVTFPTAAIAAIDLPITSWGRIRPGIGSLLWFVPPKLIQKNKEL